MTGVASLGLDRRGHLEKSLRARALRQKLSRGVAIRPLCQCPWPDCSCEALQYQSAHLVGERQLTLQDLAVEAA